MDATGPPHSPGAVTVTGLESTQNVAVTVTATLLVALVTWLLYRAYAFVFLRPLKILGKLRAQGIPGYPFSPVIGDLPLFVKHDRARDKDPALAARTSGTTFFEEGQAKFGPLWSFQFGPYPALVVSDPDVVRQLYVSHVSKLRKSEPTREILRILGNGLLTSEGELWQRQRRLLNPALSMQEVKRLLPIVGRCSSEAIASWEQQVAAAEGRTGEPLWMDRELAHLTLQVMARAAFGADMQALMGEQGLKELLGSFMGHSPVAWEAAQLTVILPFMRHVPTPLNVSEWRMRRTILSGMRRIVSARLQAQSGKPRLGQGHSKEESGKPRPSKEETGGKPRPGQAPSKEETAGKPEPGEGPPKDAAAGADRDLLQLMLEATDFEADATGNSDSAMFENRGHHPGRGEGSPKSSMRGEEEQPPGSADDMARAHHKTTKAATVMSEQQHQQQHHKKTKAATVMSEQQLMDECLTLLGAGFETTALLLTWTMMLLSQHTEWQERAREEALALCRDKGGQWSPSFEELQSSLRTITCILQEVLRLFSPVPLIVSSAREDIRVSDKLTVPKGCDIFVMIQSMHTNKAYWGPDADQFNPGRFANGVSRACSHPGAYLPFSLGPRVCLGQSFAMAEAKVVLGALLCRFRWRVADSYVHHPALFVTLRAKNGMPVVLTPL